MKNSLHHELVSYSSEELQNVINGLRQKTDAASQVLLRMVEAEMRIRDRMNRERGLRITNLARLAKKPPNVG